MNGEDDFQFEGFPPSSLEVAGSEVAESARVLGRSVAAFWEELPQGMRSGARDAAALEYASQLFDAALPKQGCKHS